MPGDASVDTSENRMLIVCLQEKYWWAQLRDQFWEILWKKLITLLLLNKIDSENERRNVTYNACQSVTTTIMM